jgi:hypothetical protein
MQEALKAGLDKENLYKPESPQFEKLKMLAEELNTPAVNNKKEPSVD